MRNNTYMDKIESVNFLLYFPALTSSSEILYIKFYCWNNSNCINIERMVIGGGFLFVGSCN